tara:strand:- start:1751 stop:1972 length:222 start_codon:yes stop_codon:yes gene_type:complete
MKYYITTTANAEQISQNKATQEGCGPVTKYWWDWIVDNRDADQSALCFQDDESVSYTTVDTLPDGFLPPEPGE